MSETPPHDPDSDRKPIVPEKAVKDFERVLEQQIDKRDEASHANDNRDEK